MPIGQFRWPIEADAEADPIALEEVQPLLIQQDAVGLQDHPQLHRRAGGAQNVDHPLHAILAEQKRFAAMKFDDEVFQRVRGGMLRDPVSESPDDFIRDESRSQLPGVVPAVVDVTVGAVEVATLSDLKHYPVERRFTRFRGRSHFQPADQPMGGLWLYWAGRLNS